MLDANPTSALRRRKSLWTSTPILALCACGIVVLLLFARCCWVGYPTEEVLRKLQEPRYGAEALRLLVENDYATRVKPLAGAIDEASAWYWESSTFNGSAICWSYECPSVEACWESTELDRSEFVPIDPTLPSLVTLILARPEVPAAWKAACEIGQGMYYERSSADRRLEHIAIDFESRRVIGCYYSGGF